MQKLYTVKGKNEVSIYSSVDGASYDVELTELVNSIIRNIHLPLMYGGKIIENKLTMGDMSVGWLLELNLSTKKVDKFYHQAAGVSE